MGAIFHYCFDFKTKRPYLIDSNRVSIAMESLMVLMITTYSEWKITLTQFCFQNVNSIVQTEL